MTNCYLLGEPGLLYQNCFYLDTNQHMAKRLFNEKGIKIIITQEDFSAGSIYGIVWCKVRKKDLEKFREATNELGRNMMIMGDKIYESFCHSIQESCERYSDVVTHI